MSIKVKCPNGHQLKVKDSFAGKVGLCPMCNATIRVPVPAPVGLMSEDDIIDVLGPPHSPPLQSSAGNGASTSGISLTPASDSTLGSSDSSLQLGDQLQKAKVNGSDSALGHAMPKKICTKCNREISAGFHICPFCRTYVANLSDL